MKVSGVVLVGGKSKRMKGNNKAFLSINNKSFLQTIIDQMLELSEIYISVDAKEKYKKLEYNLLEDRFKDIGPIGGIYSVLKVINEKYVFITACDMPNITKEFIRFLIDNIIEEEDCIVFKDDRGRVYPLGGIYSKDIMNKIEAMIEKKDYKIVNLVNNINAKIMKLSETKFEKSILDNINYPEEYHELIKKF